MLTGKVALVTGASRGIGREIAINLAKKNATVIINYNGSEDKAIETLNIIKENGGQGEIYKCNVADYEACGSMANAVIEKYGRLDILVNNAGITRDGLLMKMSESDFSDVIDINLKGTFNTVKHFSKHFLKQRAGRIINISSVSGVMGNAGQVNYSASKAGVIGLTKSVARELASRGICVNAVAPGFIETDMTENMPEAAKKTVTDKIPMGKIGKVEDIAEVVAFLAGNGAAYITGQIICVDGGMAI